LLGKPPEGDIGNCKEDFDSYYIGVWDGDGMLARLYWSKVLVEKDGA
jgi:hypothetical protein